MKTLLLAAAPDRKFYYDYVIDNSVVEDDGHLLTIKLPEKSHLVAPSVEEGVKELLAYLGVSRNVSVQAPGAPPSEPRKMPAAKPPQPAAPAVKPKERTVLTSAACPTCRGAVVIYSGPRSSRPLLDQSSAATIRRREARGDLDGRCRKAVLWRERGRSRQPACRGAQ